MRPIVYVLGASFTFLFFVYQQERQVDQNILSFDTQTFEHKEQIRQKLLAQESKLKLRWHMVAQEKVHELGLQANSDELNAARMKSNQKPAQVQAALTLESLSLLKLDNPNSLPEAEIAQLLKTYPHFNPTHVQTLLKIVEQAQESGTRALALANLGNMVYVPEVRQFLVQNMNNSQWGFEEQSQVLHGLSAKINHFSDISMAFYSQLNKGELNESSRQTVVEALAQYEIYRNGMSVASPAHEIEEAKNRLAHNIVQEDVRREVFQILNITIPEDENSDNGKMQIAKAGNALRKEASANNSVSVSASSESSGRNPGSAQGREINSVKNPGSLSDIRANQGYTKPTAKANLEASNVSEIPQYIRER